MLSQNIRMTPNTINTKYVESRVIKYFEVYFSRIS